uniref:NADH dehydrogenase subunit 3 n=1 Tax=Platevindex mortoni TaxID=637517 RepID=UPI00021B7C3E|nr:NADH dehydrogenase subunit 3 [Platevindex mortoni]
MFMKSFWKSLLGNTFPLSVLTYLLSLCLAFAVILCLILQAVYFFTSFPQISSSDEKLTPFECGFDPLSASRTPFSTRFFVLVVLFLIFDVEIALLFPVLTMMVNGSSLFLTSSLFIFLLILLIGLFHEWNEGAIDWVSSYLG